MKTSRAGRKFVNACKTFATQISAEVVPSGLIARYIIMMDSICNDVVQFRKVEGTMNMLVTFFHWAGLSISKLQKLKRLRAVHERYLHDKYFKFVWKLQSSFVKWHPNYADSHEDIRIEPINGLMDASMC